MTKSISNSADFLDVRDIIERLVELEDERDAWIENDGGDEDEQSRTEQDWIVEFPDGAEELTSLSSLLDELKSNGGGEKFRGDWYPISLIRDSYFVDAMRDLVEDIGDMPKGFPSYLEIDWEATARNLRADYSCIEYDGVTYWYR